MDILIFLIVSILLIVIIYVLIMNPKAADENDNKKEYKSAYNVSQKTSQIIFQSDEDNEYNHKYCDDSIPKQYYQQYYLYEHDIADEEFKKVYKIYASEYDDDDYNDCIEKEKDIDELYMNHLAVYDKYSLYAYDNLKQYNTNIKNVTPQQKNKKELLNNQPEESLDEYLISLFGNGIVEKRDIQEQSEDNKKEEQNAEENVDKYLKMFFGENCDLDKLKNNQNKEDIQ